ncbi:MAG: hypothetical protein V1647_05380 [Pseudomonadota bacterium]
MKKLMILSFVALFSVGAMAQKDLRVKMINVILDAAEVETDTNKREEIVRALLKANTETGTEMDTNQTIRLDNIMKTLSVDFDPDKEPPMMMASGITMTEEVFDIHDRGWSKEDSVFFKKLREERKAEKRRHWALEIEEIRIIKKTPTYTPYEPTDYQPTEKPY